MKVTKVCCQGCGADLQIDESIRYVTCNYCNTRLEVVHDQTVTHTRLLDKIERTTDRMANNLKVIELQNDLERLDREWESQRRSLMVRTKDGHFSEPSAAGSLVFGIILVGFGIVWMTITTNGHTSGMFPLFGLAFIAFAFVGIVQGTKKASLFKARRSRYNNERHRLISRLDAERGDP
jgi:hypothetical protein